MAKHIIVGMSGGVDSSVTALLLRDQGYKVQCLFMKNWEEETDECPSEQDYKDALIACDTLGLPLHSVNFAKEYRDNVFDYFLKEYKAGRTPNPDVLCNREIKFKVFLDYALDLGAEKIATGHYAQIRKSKDIYHLIKGSDRNKDQSYFLYLLGQKELSKSLFPIGDITKYEVRKIAANAGLNTSDKKDSTGICFIGERDFKEFLQRYLPAMPGDIITNTGKIAGSHDGLMYYTLGQRKGIGVGGGHGEKEAPWYVIEKDLENNQLIIGQGHDHPKLFKSTLLADQLHWISSVPKEGAHLTAKIRYRQSDQDCVLESVSANQVSVSFTQPQFAITPGQSVVFYNGDECLGGGIIR
ncbi:MAG: tRNA 2-thiouridine(34) synthase MnmA [Candidatus Marinimicrobia bacterium]|nr:tRNA 2-thiouridine(34) synthase MnmA [Candidatus Neomarinimicrobiota bacterium]MBL7059860.1 tRNA 2-thiouridine(34) synthase MnmA [Candidatus Neomarinimicrobiota bacterium]